MSENLLKKSQERKSKIEAVMEPISDDQNLSDLIVSQDVIIEEVAEKF